MDFQTYARHRTWPLCGGRLLGVDLSPESVAKARAAHPTGADVSGEALVRQTAKGRGSFSRTPLFIVRHLGLCKGYLRRASSTKRSPPFTSCLGSGTVPIEISPEVLVVRI